MDKSFIRTSPEVHAALRASRPVVALESTVIAHGLPKDLNLEIAHRLEEIIYDAGAVPATVAILNGQPQVGLSHDELKLIAQSSDVKKISTRDLPIAVARSWHGATTVAATIWIAHRVGIQVFATGGIGGVHRGQLPDISADLPELARTPMVVVCSGAKIVLDLPATREWLETNGITVVGYQCDEFPAFYSRSGGVSVDARADSVADIAEIVRAQRSLGLQSALLVTVPVPKDAEVRAALLQRTLEAALAAAAEKGLGGNQLTPFLLDRMAEESAGATLRSNLSLLENNARVAAQIARAL